MVFAVTTASSVSCGDEPLTDHDALRLPVGDRPHADCDPAGYCLGSLFFNPKLSIGLHCDSNIDASGANPLLDWGLLISPELTIRHGMLPSTYGQQPSHFSCIPTHSVNREAL